MNAKTLLAGARVLAGGYSAALFAFFVTARGDAPERWILGNALRDDEQRTLVGIVAAAIVASIAYVLFFLRRGREALIDASWEPFLLAPLALFPLYEVPVEPHVRLLAIAAVAALGGGALYLFATRSPRARLIDALDALPVDRAAPWIAGGMGLAHGIVMARLSARQFDMLWSGWDLAIYSQVHWNITTTFVPWSTTYTDQTFNHYAIHFSPIYHLTSLLYAVHRSPATLIWIENVALGLGALPAYLLARRVTGRAFVGLALAASYLLNPCAHGLAIHDFHEIVLFPPLMLALAWAVEAERSRRLVWALVALVLMIREDTPAYLVVYAAWLFVSGKRELGKKVFLASAAYLVVVHGALMPILRAGSPYVFDDRYAGLVRAGAKGKASVVQTLTTNAPYVLDYVVASPTKWEFVVLVLLPVVFLPLASRRALILLLPGFAFSLLSSFGAQYSIEFHYTAPILPFVYVTSIAALAALEKARPRTAIPLAAAALVATCLLAGKWGRSPVLNGPSIERKLDEHAAIYGDTAKAIHAAAASIPKDERCVKATGNLLPAVAERRRAYIVPWGRDCEWALIDYAPDARQAPSTNEAEIAWLVEKLRSGGYGIRYLDDRVVLVGKGEPQDRNAMFLERLEAISRR